jgi:hypothetical protein
MVIIASLSVQFADLNIEAAEVSGQYFPSGRLIAESYAQTLRAHLHPENPAFFSEN